MFDVGQEDKLRFFPSWIEQTQPSFGGYREIYLYLLINWDPADGFLLRIV